MEHLKNVVKLIDVWKEWIIDKWLSKDEAKVILSDLDIDVVKFKEQYGIATLDYFTRVIKSYSHVSNCTKVIDSIKFLREKGINQLQLTLLYLNLKSAIGDFLYFKGIHFQIINQEVDRLFTGTIKDVVEQYLNLFEDKDDTPDKSFKLLNEYKKAVDASNIVSKTDTKGIITYVNEEFCRISGYSEEELLGKPHNIVRHPDMPKEAFKNLWDTIKAKKIWRGVVKNRRKDGGIYIVDATIVPILDNYNNVVEYIGIRHDVTELESAKEQLKELNLAMRMKVNELNDLTCDLEVQASTDALTGVFNRLKFNNVFATEFKRAKKEKTPLSIIIMDIDHFKSINDTYGHQIGDSVLKEITKVVKINKKGSDIFARWGGEEFVILAIDTKIEGTRILAEHIREKIESHMFYEVERVTSSFGVATLKNEKSVDELIEKADKALYRAKQNGRNRIEVAEWKVKNKMAQIDEIKEKITHLRFWIGVMIAIIMGLISWFVSNYKIENKILLIADVIGVIFFAFLVIIMNNKALENIKKLKDL